MADVTAAGGYGSFHLEPAFVPGVPGLLATVVDDVFGSGNYRIVRTDAGSCDWLNVLNMFGDMLNFGKCQTADLMVWRLLHLSYQLL